METVTDVLAAPDLPFDRISTEMLEGEIATLAAHLAAGTCRLVLCAAELDRRGEWAGEGLRSCAHWLNWRIGMTLGAAREHLRVGHALARLPKTRAAFAAGSISYSKVRAMTRVATPENEETLAEWAGYATASQLERICAAYRKVRSLEEEREEVLEQHRRRRCSHYLTDHGTVVISAELPAEEGAVVIRAIEALAQRARQQREADRRAESADVGPSDGDVIIQDRADALVAMAEGALTGNGSAPTERPVFVAVDGAVLEDPGRPGCCHIEGVGALAPDVARRLACEVPVHRDGRTRRIPRRLRRALQRRDGGCRFPGCTNRRNLHAHHVTFWANGGRTTLSNLCLLCSHHHRLVHEGGFRLTMDGDAQVHVTSSDGRAIGSHPPPLQAKGPDLIQRHAREGPTIAGDTMPIGGEPFDLGLAIDGLLWLDGFREVPDPGGGMEGTSPDPSPGATDEEAPGDG